MRYLVLCTGNRCRSQMAHGILQYLHPEAEVCSAGGAKENCPSFTGTEEQILEEFRRVRDEIFVSMRQL